MRSGCRSSERIFFEPFGEYITEKAIFILFHLAALRGSRRKENQGMTTEEREELIEDMCDNYCKHGHLEDEDLMEKICGACPLNKLMQEDEDDD